MNTFQRRKKSCVFAVASSLVIAGTSFTGGVSGQTIEAPGTDVWTSIAQSHVALTGEYKSTQATQSAEGTERTAPVWSVYANAGYTSEYIFRGTNLTPDSDGAGFFTANISMFGFTLGVYGIHQFGTAEANTFSIGEGGGGGSISGLIDVPAHDNADNNLKFTGTVAPVTRQTRFNELDIYLSYTHELGPLDITVGNIAFFIDREAQTRVTTSGTFVDGDGVPTLADADGHTFTGNETTVLPSVQNETFDRFYIAVSAPRLFRTSTFSVVPKIYYYQTVVNDGDDPFADLGRVILAHDRAPAALAEAALGFPHDFEISGLSERNTSLGGYLEGRVDANFSVGDRISIQPYGLISCSFHDRTEPNGGSGQSLSAQLVRGRSLVGFNNVQAGVRIPITVWTNGRTALAFAPFGAYSYHIAQPSPGTDRNEVWGGAQVEFTF